MVDEPQTSKYGGMVAAPIFQAIGAAALERLGLDSGAAVHALAGGLDRGRRGTAAPAVPLGVPSFLGLSKRKAVERARDLGWMVQVNGEGYVRSQTPAPGAAARPGKNWCSAWPRRATFCDRPRHGGPRGRTMVTLGELLAGVDGVAFRADVATPPSRSSVSRPTRATVRAGDLFVALPGHAHRRRSVRRRGLPARRRRRRRRTRDQAAEGVPFVATERAGALAQRARRRALPRRPGRRRSRSSASPATNGKTTVTYLLEAIWQAAGLRPGVLGTINYRFAGAVEAAPLTTPPAIRDLRAARGDARRRRDPRCDGGLVARARAGPTFGIPGTPPSSPTSGATTWTSPRSGRLHLRAKARLFTALDASPKPPRAAVLNAADANVVGLRATIASPVVPSAPAATCAPRRSR